MRRRNIRLSDELKRVAERLRCGHVFHRHCILPWFMNVDNEASDNCPMCRQHIRFSNKVGMFNWRLFSRKIHLWNMAELNRQEEEEEYYDDDQEDEGQEDDGQEDESQEDESQEDESQEDESQEDESQEDQLSQISSISSNDSSLWEDDWADATPSSITYGIQVKFIITQQKLTLTKLHAMRFNRLSNNICRNRHR
jgi:hypothetical protein